MSKDDAPMIKGKGKEVKKPLTQMPRPPPPFPHQVKKNIEDGKFHKFISMLK